MFFAETSKEGPHKHPRKGERSGFKPNIGAIPETWPDREGQASGDQEYGDISNSD